MQSPSVSWAQAQAALREGRTEPQEEKQEWLVVKRENTSVSGSWARKWDDKEGP